MKWYENTVLMTFLGVALGALIGFGGTIYSSQLKLIELKNEHAYALEIRSLDKKDMICTQIVNSLYSLQKMNDGLIETDLATFKEESYTLLAQARIYCSDGVVNMYNEILKQFFEKQEYNGKLIDDELIPAIRNDLGIGH